MIDPSLFDAKLGRYVDEIEAAYCAEDYLAAQAAARRLALRIARRRGLDPGSVLDEHVQLGSEGGDDILALGNRGGGKAEILEGRERGEGWEGGDLGGIRGEEAQVLHSGQG